MAALLAVWATAPPPVRAQTPEESGAEGTPATLKRVLDAVGPEARPVRPLVGIVVPGSGPAAGAAVEFTPAAWKRWGASAEGLLSTRNYQHALFRVGLIAQRRLLPELQPADSNVTSVMDAGRRGTGAAIYVEHRYRRLPRLSLFGVEGGEQLEPLRTDFGVRRTTTDLVAQWSRVPGVGVAARVGHLTTASFPGTDARHPDTAERFGPLLTDAGVARTRFLTAAIGVVVDRTERTTRPTLGWTIQAAATQFSSVTAAAPSFARLSLDARALRHLAWKRHVLAARLLASGDTVASSGHVPFYLQQTLGGSSTLRAFDSYRLRGERLVHVTLESRWRVTSRLELAPFVDSGRVMGGHLEAGTSGWLVAPGLGARVHHKQHTVGRVDVARGRDGWRLAYGFDAPF